MVTLRTREPLQSWHLNATFATIDTIPYSGWPKNCRGGIYKLEDEPSLAFITTSLSFNMKRMVGWLGECFVGECSISQYSVRERTHVREISPNSVGHVEVVRSFLSGDGAGDRSGFASSKLKCLRKEGNQRSVLDRSFRNGSGRCPRCPIKFCTHFRVFGCTLGVRTGHSADGLSAS